MKIIKSMYLQEKIKELAQQCAQSTTPLTIITEHVLYVEDMLLKDQDVLFSIEVKTLQQFEKDLLLKNRQFNRTILAKTDLIMKIRHILITKKFRYFKMSENPYQLIDEIIRTLHMIHDQHLDLSNLHNASALTRQKCQELQTIDQALHGYLNLEEACANLLFTVNQPVIVLGDEYTTLAQRNFFKQLDAYTDVTMYLTCHEGDLLSSFYEGESIVDNTQDNITEHLFNLDPITPSGHAFVISAGSPMQEVLKITSDIRTRIVKEKAHYRDFMIIVESSSYRDYLRQIFDAWQYPHDLDETTAFYYDADFRKIVKNLSAIHDDTISRISEQLLALNLSDSYHQIIRSINGHDYISCDEYRLLLEEILPDRITPAVPHDCIHITDYQHALVADPKYIYMMNMNEGDVPKVMNDSGLLLDEDLTAFTPRPLSLSEQLLVHYMNITRALLNPHRSLTFSYALNDMDGKEKMPSTLMNRLTQIFHLETIQPDLYLHLNHFYLHHGKAPTFVLNEDIDHYDNKPVIIAETLRKYLGRGMSVSRLETYNKCPYSYYLRYGLKIQPLYEDVLQPTELGSLCHYIMEKALDDEEHLTAYAHTYVKQNLDAKYHASALNTYFIDHLIDDMKINVEIVKEQLGDFEIISKEEEVKGTLGEIPVQGFIDRLDHHENRIRIIDYKSGDKDLNIPFAMQGFNIQMLAYLDLYLKNHPQMQPGAVFYYSMKRRILNRNISQSMTLHSPVNQADYFKAFKMNGYFFDEAPYSVVKASVENSTPSVLKKNDQPKAHARLLSEKQFHLIMEAITSYINELYTTLKEGHIDLTPAIADNNDPSIYPCTFCPYPSICLYDVFVNENRVIQSHYGADILKEEN